MTHDQLLDKIEDIEYWQEQYAGKTFIKALLAVVQLHRPVMQWSGGYDGEENPLYAEQCTDCSANGFTQEYPCQTIQAIEKELN
jgi:hypothetical protein